MDVEEAKAIKFLQEKIRTMQTLFKCFHAECRNALAMEDTYGGNNMEEIKTKLLQRISVLAHQASGDYQSNKSEDK